ncbi:MAG: hypothetical protein Q7T76_12655 [Ferruginibacter sp.]|nr:hypothetical protein [Ferruginibacter sp.]
MADNLTHTESTIEGNLQLPLQSFFLSLRQHGFKVTPAQIADSHAVIARYAAEVDNEASLGAYLSPLFANSEEEQIKFKELFEQQFLPIAGEHKLPIDSLELLRRHLAKHWWKYLLALIVVIGIIVVIMWPQGDVERLPLKLRSSLEGKGRKAGNDFTPHTNEDFSVTMVRADTSLNSFSDNSLHPIFDWGDQSQPDSSGHHRYAAKGVYQLTAIVQIHQGTELLYADTLRQQVLVCDERNELKVQASTQNDSVKINQQFRISATVTGRQPDRFEWFENQESIKKGPVLDTVLQDAGVHQLTCYAIFDSLPGPCSISRLVSITVHDPSKPLINASFASAPDAKTVVLPRRVKPWLFLLTGLLFLISFPAMVWFNKWRRKPRRDQQQQQNEVTHLYNDLVSKFSGKRPPFDLPFRTRNNLLQPEPALSEVAWQMRRRIDDDATYMHLGKTINKAVRNAGFFRPVTVPRTHQSEYLVLIDETIVNNQQVKLFEYVVELLRKQNVFIDKFYYKQDPMLCYNRMEPLGVSLEKLFEKYPRHILLVFGTGEQLIYPHYPVFDPAFQHLVRRWKFKAIITPTPVTDWGLKEKVVLGNEVLVVPADVYGQLLMMEHIFRGGPVSQGDLMEFGDQFYRAATFDVEEIDELMAYCEQADWARSSSGVVADNILFQWIAALAVYPRVRWELIIGIGKSVLEHHRLPGELNFTNLLRIARIQWMKEGRFPDFTRLELLKRLTIQHEVLARETILALLQEIPAQEITGENFVFEEKEIQRIVNEFNLYVYDPVRYAGYSTSASLFEKLWLEKKILDGPAKVYLKNEDRSWTTMLQGTSSTGEVEKQSLDDYMATPPVEKESLKTFRLWLGFAIASIFLVSFLGLIGLTILNFSTGNWLNGLTEQKTGFRDVQFDFKDSSGLKGRQTALLQLDTVAISLPGDSIFTLPILINDSSKQLAISLDGDLLFNSALLVDKDKYQITLHLPPVDSPSTVSSISARLLLPKSCTGAIYDYQRNVSAADAAIVISDSILDVAVVDGTPCLNEIAAGNNISSATVSRIRENFKASGVTLGLAVQSLYPLRDNEMLIYYRPSKPVPLETKMNVVIMLSDESLRTSGNGFKRALEANGFSVSALSVGAFSNNSQITYYSDLVPAKTLALINQVYSRYYPQLKIPTKLDNNSRISGSQAMIRIYIKKFESVPRSNPGKNAVPVQTRPQEEAPVQQTQIQPRDTPIADLTKQNAIPRQPVTTPNTKDGAALSKQGIAAYNQKNYEQAVTTLSAVVAENANDATAFYYLGMSLNAQYKYEEAINAFTKALGSRDKSFTASAQGRAYLNRGLAKQQLKQDACEDFRMAEKLGEKEASKYVKGCY